MKLKSLHVFLLTFALGAFSSCFIAMFALGAFSSCSDKQDKLIDENLQLAVQQYKYMSALLAQQPSGRLPQTYIDSASRLRTSGTGWWCSGFYPGSLWYLYEYSNDEALKAEAIRSTELLEKEQYNKGTHDLGFMLFCSFGHGYRLTQNPAYKEIILNGSESLCSRYREAVGCIRSWDSNRDRWQFPVIIDNMMNLEMLAWVSRETGNNKYRDIAVSHANKTIENHYRDDYSCYHVVDYDTLSGVKRLACTAQGYSDSSAWARGQSWGLYGYTMFFRETNDAKYLEQACRVADFLLNHPNLPADKIPYWDYDAPNIPDALRDVSSAAIMASALIELSQHTQGEQSKTYLNTAKTILKNLSTPTYRAEVGTNGGFVLKHSVGSLPHNSEVDVPLTYADYYFIEALMRLKNLKR